MEQEQESNNINHYSYKKNPTADQSKQIMDYLIHDQLTELKEFQQQNQISFNFFHDDTFNTPLLYAVQHGKKDFITYLLEQKALVNEQRKEAAILHISTTSLLFAEIFIHTTIDITDPFEKDLEISPKTLKEIMKSGILWKGPTPLHVAAYGNNGTWPETFVLALVKILLDAGGDPNLKMYGNKVLPWKYSPKKPAGIAYSYGYLKASVFLREHEDIFLENEEDKTTFLYLERHHGNSEITTCPVVVKKGHIAHLMHKLFKDIFDSIIEMQKHIAQKNNTSYTIASKPSCFLDIYRELLCKKNVEDLLAQSSIPSDKQQEILEQISVPLTDNFVIIYQQCFPTSKMAALAEQVTQKYRPEKNEK